MKIESSQNVIKIMLVNSAGARNILTIATIMVSCETGFSSGRSQTTHPDDDFRSCAAGSGPHSRWYLQHPRVYSAIFLHYSQAKHEIFTTFSQIVVFTTESSKETVFDIAVLSCDLDVIDGNHANGL